jgi:hypothetical protein
MDVDHNGLLKKRGPSHKMWRMRATQMEQSEKSSQCAICFDDGEIGMHRVKLGCGHKFHRACIERAMNTDGKRRTIDQCPMCRNLIGDDGDPRIRDVTIRTGASTQGGYDHTVYITVVTDTSEIMGGDERRYPIRSLSIVNRLYHANQLGKLVRVCMDHIELNGFSLSTRYSDEEIHEGLDKLGVPR